jgi:hypothetical protein
MPSILLQLEAKSWNIEAIFQFEENGSKYPSISFLMYDTMSEYLF